MFNREESPSAEASHFVLSYWEFTISAETPEPIMHEVFPEGCVTIIFLPQQTALDSEINCIGN